MTRDVLDFVVVNHEGSIVQLLRQDGSGYCLPVDNPADYERFSVREGEDFSGAISRWRGWKNSGYTLQRLDAPVNSVFKRIARPTANAPHYLQYPVSTYRDHLAVAAGQLTSLMNRLMAICQYTHPSGTNLLSFGHETRNTLILACTEVEGQFRGILSANGRSPIRSRWSTEDYVALLQPMRLDEYTVTPLYYPWMADLQPFREWNIARPTASLPWYDAYNATKHDREGAFDQATLERTFLAVAACYVLLIAQGGSPAAAQIQSFGFFKAKQPVFLPHEHYHQVRSAGWTEVDF